MWLKRFSGGLACNCACNHACMVALQIRDVPEETRDQLVVLARARGESLQAFLLRLVQREVGVVRRCSTGPDSRSAMIPSR